MQWHYSLSFRIADRSSLFSYSVLYYNQVCFTDCSSWPHVVVRGCPGRLSTVCRYSVSPVWTLAITSTWYLPNLSLHASQPFFSPRLPCWGLSVREQGGGVCDIGNGVTQLLLQLLLRTSCSVLAVLLSHLLQLNFDCIWYGLLFGAPTCGEGISIAPLLARPQSGADNVCQLLIMQPIRAAHLSNFKCTRAPL